MADSKIKSYKDLQVWQKSHDLTKSVLKSCQRFPNSIEARIVREQLVRAATSVPANIAEGYGGARGKGYRNYLTIARRSTNEADYWLYLSQDIGFISTALYSEFSRKCTEIILMLTGIINKL